MEDLLLEIALGETIEHYCEDKETIEDLINIFKKCTNEMDKSEDYENCIAKVVTRISLLSDLLLMKKLKNNRDDMFPLIEVLEKEVENLKIIAKEVDVDVTTSK